MWPLCRLALARILPVERRAIKVSYADMRVAMSCGLGIRGDPLPVSFSWLPGSPPGSPRDGLRARMAPCSSSARPIRSSCRTPTSSPTARGGRDCFIDAGGPVKPLIAAAERMELTPTHVLLTHHHYDHVSEVGALRERWPKLEVLIHPLEREGLGEIEANALEAGEMLRFGTLEVRPLPHRAHRRNAVVPGKRAERRSRQATIRQRRSRGVHRRRGGRVHRRHAVRGLGWRGARSRAHDVYRPEGLDHGHADGVAARHGHPSRPRRRDERRARSGRRTRSSASGAAWIRRGPSPARRWASRRRWCCCCEDYDGGTKAWVRWPGRYRRHRARARRSSA